MRGLLPLQPALIIDPILPEDFLGGSSQSLEAKYGAAVINPEGDWTPYLPTTENQDTSDGDSYACCSFGTSNAVEMLARLNFKESKNLSDRFLAKISGTIVGQGNSPKTVADTLRHKWSVDEAEWPDVDTVEEYYADIPEDLKTLALARGAEFEFGYQYITNSLASIKTALKSSPVCIAVTAWMQKDGVYVRVPGIQENHWTTIIKVLDNGNYKVFDSFPPFIKEVKPECAQSVAMSYYLDRQVIVESAWTKFIKFVVGLFKAPEAPVNTPPEPPKLPQEAPSTPTPTPPIPATTTASLETFCLAIRSREGWFPGSRSMTNNNPGNCRYSSVGYAAVYLPVSRDPQGFAVFKDYPTGWLYLKNLVREYAKAHPTWTVLQFFQTYSPSTDGNDPVSYAKEVAGKLGVDYQTFVISNLV